jgi:hypothetical protein
MTFNSLQSQTTIFGKSELATCSAPSGSTLHFAHCPGKVVVVLASCHSPTGRSYLKVFVPTPRTEMATSALLSYATS